MGLWNGSFRVSWVRAMRGFRRAASLGACVVCELREPVEPSADLECKDIPYNGNQKKGGVVILTSDKINFKIKTVTRDKEG